MTEEHPASTRTLPAPDSADRSAPDGGPGALRGTVTLTLETRQAQRLVQGRAGTADQPVIIGLIGFASLLRGIWHGARADDPYADDWLLKIHAALAQADQALQDATAAVQSQLAACAAIEVALAASVRPVRIPLRFSNPYAYRGAQLVADFDRLARTVLSARHVGVMPRADGERVLAQGGRPLRRAFLSPLGYRLTGVTRADLVQGTAKAIAARAILGEVPDEVLAGRLRAPHAPGRPLPASALAAHRAAQPLPARF